MIPFDLACKIVMDNAVPLPSGQVSLSESFGRTLAVDVRADRDTPPRDLSAMDGIACRSTDLDNNTSLTIIETIGAGHGPSRALGKGECSRIMTGAALPGGADTVVMVEDITEHDGVVTINRKQIKSNIRYRAEEAAAGTVVARAGALITPPVLAVLALAGCDPVTVSTQPRVGVIATGDELVEPAGTPRDFQIRNSNSSQLCAQVSAAGALPRYYGIAADTPDATLAFLRRAIEECDVVLLSGGVSMGEFDFVPGVLKQAGVRILFDSVAVKPGKPTVFGTDGMRFFFGMPGNPVSTFVIFEMLVRPFLMKLMGCSAGRKMLKARLGETIRRKNADRMEFRPVKFGSDGCVYGIEYRGSAHIHAYTEAQGVISIPKGISELNAGEDVAIIVV